MSKGFRKKQIFGQKEMCIWKIKPTQCACLSKRKLRIKFSTAK